MKKIISMMLAFTATAAVIPNAAAQENKAEFYVSVRGNDYNDGSFERPYRTIERAKTSVKYLKNNSRFPIEGVDIILREGRYELSYDIYFNSEDSGLNGAPVTYKAYNNESVIVTTSDKISGAAVSYDSRLPEQSRGIVRETELDLSKLCIGTKNQDNFIIFDNSGIYRTSRYPNSKEYFACTAVKKDNSFYYTYDDALSSRVNNWSDKNRIVCEGYPQVKWKYGRALVSGFDSENNTIIAAPTDEGVSKNPSIWFSNILEELDEPGEYYYDSTNGKLFYYPSGNGDVYAAKRSTPILEIVNTKNISFENITFEGTFGNGIESRGSDNLKFTNCVFKNISGDGIDLFDCTNTAIVNSEVYGIGGCGIKITGGDRYNLVPSNNVIDNCDIHDFAKLKYVYAPGVSLNGVGDTVKNCDIHEAFHQGLAFDGNDCIIKNNKFYNLCVGTEDAGAIYSYSNSTCRGNVIEANYFENIGTSKPTATTPYSTYGVWAVYLDGNSSGQTVKNNVFSDIIGGVFANNGGNIDITDNIFTDVTSPITAYPVTGEFNNVHYFGAYNGRYYNTFYNKAAWSKYKNYDKLLNGEWKVPSDVYTDITVKGNRYYGELSLYTEQWVSVSTYEHPNHPYKRQTVYVDNKDGYIRDDAVVIFEDNVKCAGEASVDKALYGRK